MRPEEKWSKNPKDPNQKKKRAYRPKSKRVAAKKGQDDDSKSEAAEPGSEGSSPAEGATEAEMEVDDDSHRPNAEVVEPPLPPHVGRATSAEPTMAARKMAPQIHPSVGMQTKALQSSPIRDEASHSHPVEVGLTPKPVRRQLFPSPNTHTATESPISATKNKAAMPLGELSNICRRSPRLNKSKNVLGTRPKTPDLGGKENHGPAKVDDDELNDLFHDDDDRFQLPPQTPTPARRSDRLLLKTPNQTPRGGTSRTPGAQPSPSAHQGCATTQTPKRDFIMGSNRTVEEMTPFTLLIHKELVREDAAKKKAAAAADAKAEAQAQLVRDAIAQQQQSEYDFSDLPTLNGMSPMSRQLASLDNIDFSCMTNEFPDIFRPDLDVGSSPSSGFYNFVNADYVDPTLGGGGGGGSIDGGQWNGAGGTNGQNQSTAGSSLAAQETMGLRRSPRKNKSG